MPENTETANAGEGAEVQEQTQQESQGSNAATNDGFRPPESQEELNQIIESRLARERKKFEDYDELKSQAEASEQLRAMNEELTSKVQQFETERELSVAAKSVAEEFNVPSDILRGSTREELEEHARSVKKLMDSMPNAPVIKSQGKTPEKLSGDSKLEAVRNLFGA